MSFLEQRVKVLRDRTLVEEGTGALVVRSYDHEGTAFDTVLDFEDYEACLDFLVVSLGALSAVSTRELAARFKTTLGTVA